MPCVFFLRLEACHLEAFLEQQSMYLADRMLQVGTADDVIGQPQVSRWEARQWWPPQIHHNLHKLRVAATSEHGVAWWHPCHQLCPAFKLTS